MTQFLLVSIQPHTISDDGHFQQLEELWQLCTSYGGQVVGVVTQKREIHDKGMYVGKGKLDEVRQKVTELKADVVVFNAVIKPGQLYEVKTYLNQVDPQIEVWDRVDLILQIFARRAQTAEARLQIELAQMHHMGPRIYGMGVEMSRQGGGIGSRGVGETNTERMKRHWSREMKKTEDKLAKMASDRERQLTRRRRVGLQTVSLVGYTNAGKTSLYNTIVGKHKLAKDALFATLDASVGKVYLPALQKEVLVSDTIGFIQGLPPELVEAFTSTLMESLHADVLLHVLDAADGHIDQKMDVVRGILRDLHLTDRPCVYVFNKADLLPANELEDLQRAYADLEPVYVSAQTGAGIEDLLQRLVTLLSVEMPA